MPLLLAIESSTNRASLALFRDGVCVFEGGFESDRNHNSLLFDPLEKALARLEGERLDEVVIGTGPGSYSGTRVGIAAGQGVALVHGCPAVGLSSLLATPVRRGFAIGDARRGSAWWATVGDGLPQPELIDPAELASRLRDQPAVFSFENVTRLGLPAELEVAHQEPTAPRLAEAWLALPEETKARLRAEAPQPAYLRPPHITEAKKGHPLLRKKE
ncbi:tRNA (adenosine(37)-N6)-threonylcarbamoyltransferase complex dimerization subunit type 1 TsaB [Haloferula sargassicola]|uniref:Gcp-like domain-containing protein n=1 Tax=Haloferula sargassicola TaxID=490096 RepID=A0ABP9UID9_9BACT